VNSTFQSHLSFVNGVCTAAHTVRVLQSGMLVAPALSQPELVFEWSISGSDSGFVGL
jgi:hypothetical protein